MATFTYRYTQEMTPIGNRKYATTYIKQSHAEHARLRTWLVQVAEEIIGTCEHNASLAEWFTTPNRDFKRSQRGQYYTPEDLLTDMISQLAQGRDMTQAMLDRWNRLCQGTPWEIDLTTTDKTPPARHLHDRVE
jgi:hypothetical protein